MNEIVTMLERQAAWQRSRASLTWTVKLRMAARLRDAAIALRGKGDWLEPGSADLSCIARRSTKEERALPRRAGEREGEPISAPQQTAEG